MTVIPTGIVIEIFGDTHKIGSPNLVFNTPEKREFASKLPVWKRQLVIKHLRVPYHTYNRGLAMIGTLHRPVEGGLPNLGVVGGLLGESRCGKTIVCEAYAERYPARDGELGREFPVVYMDASIGMSRTRAGHKIQRATEARHRILTREDPSEWSVDRILKCKSELLIVDDSHFMFFNQRSSQTAIEMFGFVKDVVDTKRVSVLLVGDASIDEYVHGIDAFRNREYRSETLEPLTNSAADLELFGDLLKSIDRRLPFREPSHLDRYRDHFHLYSSGHIGLVMNILHDAGYFALNDHASCIMIEHLRAAVRTRIAPGDDNDYFGYKSAKRK
jgi:hypothetical protein